jgi:hypothetical protein
MACGLWLMAYRWWLPFFGAGPPSTARPCAQPMLLVLTNLMLTLLFMKPTKCRPPPEVYSLQWCSQYMPGCRQSLRWNSGFQMDDVSPHFRWKIPWGTALKYIRSPARGGVWRVQEEPPRNPTCILGNGSSCTVIPPHETVAACGGALPPF